MRRSRTLRRTPRLGTALALAIVGAALAALSVPARPALSGQTTFAVTKTADTNDGACTPNDCSLREAIIAANAETDAEIDVPAGTYKLKLQGQGEDSAATGDLDLRAGMTIRGAGARKTIIDGNGIDRVFHLPNQGSETPFTTTISGVTITGGVVTNSTGGGISHFARGATLNLSRSTVRGNRAVQGGGIQNGLSLFMGGTMAISRSTISGNKAPGGQGGGIQTAAVMTIENSTISGNKSQFGGGIMKFDGTLRITDSTIAFNRAQQPGGGIFINSGPPTLKNTIISKNKSDFANRKNCSDAVVSEGNNLEKGTSCGLTQPGDLNANPKLEPLAKNGGPTNTHALKKRSPAINAGGAPFPATDQRGVSRPQGAASDIGAYEKKRRRR